MKPKTDQDNSATSDSAISAGYTAIARETVPEWLDQYVLRLAEAGMRKNEMSGFRGLWMRPLAFIATAGICLAIFMDLSETPTVEPVLEKVSISGDPVPIITNDNDGRPAAALSRAVEASGRRLQQLDETQSGAKPRLQARYCSEEQSQGAEPWWRCIDELRNGGNPAAAMAEEKLFREVFPEFIPDR